MADLTYDGQVLFWNGVGRYRATSGLRGFQDPQQQCLTVLNTRIRRKPRADSCGCKSAIFAYSIHERVPIDDEFVEYERALGRFVAGDAEPRAFGFVLWADTRIPPKGALTVSIVCAAVD